MPYTLRIPENLEEVLLGWKLPPSVVQHLQREAESPRLLDPPHSDLLSLSSIANRFRWPVIVPPPNPMRLDFHIEIDVPSEELRVIGVRCFRPVAMQFAEAKVDTPALQWFIAGRPR